MNLFLLYYWFLINAKTYLDSRRWGCCLHPLQKQNPCIWNAWRLCNQISACDAGTCWKYYYDHEQFCFTRFIFLLLLFFLFFFIIDFVSRLAIFLTAPSILWKFRLHHANLSDIYLLKVVVVNVFFDFQAVRQMKETQLTLLLQSMNQRPLTIRNRWDQLSDISWFS